METSNFDIEKHIEKKHGIHLFSFAILLLLSALMWLHIFPRQSEINYDVHYFQFGVIMVVLLFVNIFQRIICLTSATRKIVGITSILLVFFHLNSFSNVEISKLTFEESPGKVKGVVIDSESSKPVEFANVVIYKTSDSSMVSGIVSDENGMFTMDDLPYGKYYAIASFIGYKKTTIHDIIINKESNTAELGNIKLEVISGVLEEVIVTGQKQQMEIKFEKKVFNVGIDISNRGENAAEILSNVPSVEVDMEGSVRLRGSQNLQILVDGKPSAMTKSGKGLKQLQGNLIDKIEVISVPSARYDASGEAGIINIILKKNKDTGIHGTFNLNAGNPANYGGSYSLNYRMKKINIFSNLGLNYREEKGYGSSSQKFIGADTSFIYNQESTFNGNGVALNYSLGLDYYLNDKNIITLSVVNEVANEKKNRNITYRDFSFENELTSVTYRNSKEKDVENNVDVSLSYKKLFSKKDQVFTAEFKWIQSTEPEKADINQIFELPANPLMQRTGNTENEYKYILQADYIYPFGDDSKLETGYKSSLRRIKCDYFVDQKNDQEEWIALPDYTDNLNYIENIHSFYLMMNQEFGRFTTQTGIRTEYSAISTDLKTSGSYNFRDYINFFPSASIAYNLSKPLKLQVNYSYRLNRPDFRDLQPFNDFTDSRVLRKGNPDLDPEFIHSLEGGLLFNTERVTVLGTIYNRLKKGVIYNYELTSANGVVNEFPINLLKENTLGFESNIAYNYNNAFAMSSNFNFYRSQTNGFYQNDNLESLTYTWTNRTLMKLQFRKWDFQTSVNYHAPYITPQGKELSSYYLDMGISREIFNGNGTLTFSIKDLLNTQKQKSIIETENYYSSSSYQRERRQILVTLTFRLNKESEAKNDKDEEEDD